MQTTHSIKEKVALNLYTSHAIHTRII